MKYTVRQATATGKTDSKYGSEYIVHFNEDDREVRLSKKDPVEAGQEFNGEIKTNAYGAYFKKDPFVPGAQTATSSSTGAPKYQNNSDGQRQGMCINNAAAFVNSQATDLVDPKTWAKTVHLYADELYKLGDLGIEKVEEVAIENAPQNVKDVFGAN